MKLFSVALVSLMLFSTLSSAETQFIRSIQCKLMESPNFKAEVVTTLSQGTEVRILKNQGVWVEVETPEKLNGWVSKFLLSPVKPDENASRALEFQAEDLKNVRQRASVITSAAAARGLTAREVEGSVNTPIVAGQNFEALKLMESYRPTDAEIEAFIRSIPQSQ
jgi:hypothetical protein